MLGTRLACRAPCYRPFEDAALAHIALLGVRNVELRAPRDDAECDRIADQLATHALSAIVLQPSFDVAEDRFLDPFLAQLPRFARLHTSFALIALRPVALPASEVCRRLALTADHAAECGVTLLLETHPDLSHNSRVAAETLAAVNRPNVRLNFDTANILFYNDDLSPTDELCASLPILGGVHLKDTAGGKGVRRFGPLGAGRVDFAAILRLLHQAEFDGPLTIELDAPEPHTRSGVEAAFEQSVQHIRRLLEEIDRSYLEALAQESLLAPPNSGASASSPVKEPNPAPHRRRFSHLPTPRAPSVE